MTAGRKKVFRLDSPTSPLQTCPDPACRGPGSDPQSRRVAPWNGSPITLRDALDRIPNPAGWRPGTDLPSRQAAWIGSQSRRNGRYG